jgi:hypothetical protein
MISPGYINLIHEILMLARSDLQYGVKKRRGKYVQIRNDALSFIHSEWFETLCIVVNLDPDVVCDQFLRSAKASRKKLR